MGRKGPFKKHFGWFILLEGDISKQLVGETHRLSIIRCSLNVRVLSDLWRHWSPKRAAVEGSAPV